VARRYQELSPREGLAAAVIVAIDEASWTDRSMAVAAHIDSRLIDKLGASRPAQSVVDILFVEPAAFPQSGLHHR